MATNLKIDIDKNKIINFMKLNRTTDEEFTKQMKYLKTYEEFAFIAPTYRLQNYKLQNCVEIHKQL